MFLDKLFKKKETVRTRFAPSPTGYVHIGNLRNALYCYLYAKKHNGQFLLRIEDTDQNRYVEDAVVKLIDTLHTFSLNYDEGPHVIEGSHIEDVGPHAPYIQSHRLEIYKKYAEQLVASGHAYYSFKAGEELDAIRKKLSATNTVLKQHHLDESFSDSEVSTKITQGEKYVIRLKVPLSGKVVFEDMVKGRVEFDYSGIDDSVILKSDGYPTYHLASIVDDSLMDITHVLRSDEWLSSVPKHLFIYESLNFHVPQFAHLPLILNPDKSKLSKRQGDVAAEDYLKKGYLPEAILNFVALLGWNPGEGETEEIFSLDELVKRFDITHVNKSGAVFDIKKLNWMNAKYLREKLSLADFIELTKEQMTAGLSTSQIGNDILNNSAKLDMFAQIARERIEYLQQLNEFFLENEYLNDSMLDFPSEKLIWKKSDREDAKNMLSEVKIYLETVDESSFNNKDLETSIKGWITDKGYQVGNVLWPLRVSLTGQDRSPNPFEVAYLLGKSITVERISKAIEKLG